MSAPAPSDSDRTPTGATRAAVLGAVRQADQPLTVRQIAGELGLHTNTVRFHLARLLRNGSLQERRAGPSGPGRPRMVYTVAPAEAAPPAAKRPEASAARLIPAAAPDPESGYQFLAEVLTGHLAATSPAPAAAATEVGEAWGHYLADRPVPFSRTTEEESIEQVTTILERIGFAPAPGEDGRHLLLRNCPFRTVADHRPSVVCSVHFGLMRGALAEMGAPVEIADLDRFEAPYPCIARLRPVGAEPGEANGETDGETVEGRNLPGWAGRITG